MNKQLTSILLISGTCIGAGMIALPISLAKIGIIPSIILMFLIWLYSYYTSLVFVELNLNSENKNLHLELLCKKYSGKYAQIIGNISVKLLSYSLISAYIYGGSSILQNLLNLNVNTVYIQTILTLITIFIIQMNRNLVSKTNGYLFIGFLIFIIFLIFLLFFKVNYNNIPWNNKIDFNNISNSIVILFTSFGYQICSNALMKYCDNDIKIIKNALFYGSIIPLILYICWTFVILSVIYNNDINFYNLIINENVNVGNLIDKLSNIISLNNLNFIVWIISILAIFTSLIGVSLSLKESYNNIFKEKNIKNYDLLSTLITILPSYIITVLIPNAFMKVLGYAGIMSIIMAILLPIYLYLKTNLKQKYIKILNKKLLFFCFIIGVILIFLNFI